MERRSSRTVTAGSDFHRPRSTCFFSHTTTSTTGAAGDSAIRRFFGKRVTPTGSRPFLLVSARVSFRTGSPSPASDTRCADEDPAMDHFTTRDLRAAGWSPRRIAGSVQRGEMLRIRRGHFAPVGTADTVIRAVRVGGRLGCLSELRHRGIWVLDDTSLHVQIPPHASDLHHPDRPGAALGDPLGARLHWHAAAEEGPPGHASVLDALADASRCLERRAWMASVDSAVRLGELKRSSMGELARRVNASSRTDLARFDSRAESGLETIVRVLARDLGFRVRPQVRFAGVGRVDLVIEDWIVIEADGSEFHDVAMSPRDRRRDALLAAMNRTVLRPGYSLIVHEPDAVARQMIAAVANHRRVRGSGDLAARARMRARRIGIS